MCAQARLDRLVPCLGLSLFHCVSTVQTTGLRKLQIPVCNIKSYPEDNTKVQSRKITLYHIGKSITMGEIPFKNTLMCLNKL